MFSTLEKVESGTHGIESAPLMVLKSNVFNILRKKVSRLDLDVYI